MSVTQELVTMIRAKAITERDYRQAALITLDAIANVVAGRKTKVGELIRKWYAAGSYDAGRRAFVMGALAHILETDDLHRMSTAHPGCVVIPAAFALGSRKGITAQQLLTAVLHGFEAMCRIGNSVGGQHYKVWHNTGTCGPYGSAMAASAVLVLKDEEAVHALGNAGTQSSGFWEFLRTGAMSKHLHAGRASEAGVLAADLAAVGFTGPSTILEGDKGFFVAACPDAKQELVLADPDADWQLHQTSIKPWPSCRHTHPGIDAALDLYEQLAGEPIECVQAEVYKAVLNVCDRPSPQTEYEAKFSVQHCIAAALADGEIKFESFNSASRARHASLRSNIAVRVDETFESAYPRSWGTKISVRTANGNILAVAKTSCKGDPEAPLSDDEILDKARSLMSFGGLNDEDIDTLIGAVLNLGKGHADWDSLSVVFP